MGNLRHLLEEQNSRAQAIWRASKTFFLQALLKSRQGALLDMVRIKEEMARDMKAGGSLSQTDYEVI